MLKGVIHKLEGMVNVKDKTCIHPNCKNWRLKC